MWRAVSIWTSTEDQLYYEISFDAFLNRVGRSGHAHGRAPDAAVKQQEWKAGEIENESSTAD
jgi:hypothetical protein